MRPLWLALVAAVAATRVGAQQTAADTIHFGGQALVVHRYAPGGVARCPSVLLLSGDGGWQQGVVKWAEALQANGHEVMGVDAARLVKLVGAAGLVGVVAAWPEFARLATMPPVVLGYSRGATIGLVLATRADDPPPAVLLGVDTWDHFGGPAVPPGLAPGVRKDGDYAVDLRPLFRDTTRTSRVAIIHGRRDRVSPYDTLRPWFDSLPGPKRLTVLPNSGHGFGDSRTVLPAIREALLWAAGDRCR